MTPMHEVSEPIINSPFDAPARHWHIAEGEPAELRDGRRPAVYYYRDPKEPLKPSAAGIGGTAVEMASSVCWRSVSCKGGGFGAAWRRGRLDARV